MVFFAGSNIFLRFAWASPRHFLPQAATVEHASISAPSPIALCRDQEHFDAVVERVALPYAAPFAPLPRPLAPRRIHTPPVAVVDAVVRSGAQPPSHLIDAIDVLNAALRYVSGLAPARPELAARLSSLDIVQSSLPITQFLALRDEVVSSPLWRGDAPLLLPAGKPKRRLFLRTVVTHGGDHGACLESIVDYREPFEAAFDPEPFETELDPITTDRDDSADELSDSDVVVGSFGALQLSFLSDSEADGAITVDDRGAGSEMFLDFSAALDRDGFIDVASGPPTTE